MPRWAASAGFRYLVAGAAVLAVSLTVSSVGAWRGGQVEYDGAVYLERALFLAERLEDSGASAILRLPWSLQFEAPKPPLYVGLLVAIALGVGRESVALIVYGGTLLPLVALLAATWALARRGARGAGAHAVLILASMPLVWWAGGRILVETTLAAIVTAACAIALHDEAEAARRRVAVMLGAAIGLAALTKLTALVYGAAVLATYAVRIARQAGWSESARHVGIASLAASAVAGPWYLRNGTATLEFARFAANSWAHEDAGAIWSRPLRLLHGAVGLPVLVLAIGFAAYTLLTRGARAGGRSELDRLTFAVAGSSAVMVIAPRNFDARFWFPALGLIAAWLASRLSVFADTVRRRTAAGVALAVALALAAVGAWTTLSGSTPWLAADVIESSGLPPEVGTICNLGDSFEWNSFQLRLMTQIAALRPRPRVVDLGHDVAAEDLESALDQCGMLFLLDPGEILPERSQIRQNANLMEIRSAVEKQLAEDFERYTRAEARLARNPRVEVWQRAQREEPRRSAS